MNKIKTSFALVAFVIMTLPFNASADTRNPIAPMSTTEQAARAETLLNRLDEINAMDKTTMSRSSKRELNKEVRSIRKELKTNGDGVYLSVGAVLIIILLLILLL